MFILSVFIAFYSSETSFRNSFNIRASNSLNPGPSIAFAQIYNYWFNFNMILKSHCRRIAMVTNAIVIYRINLKKTLILRSFKCSFYEM